jgi:predicted NBD/HSP70 family sugar kinase
MRRASVYVLMNHLRSRGVNMLRVRELDPTPEAAREPLDEWQNDCADALAQAITGIVAVVDIEAVVIDSILPATILHELVAKVRGRFGELLPAGLLPPEIIAGSLGQQASPMGAAMLPFQHLFAPDSDVLFKKGMVRRPAVVGVR